MKANSQNKKGALKTISKLVGDFTVSLDYDRRLYKEDIDGSIAHIKMLAAQGIIPSADCDLIVDALIEIEQEIEIEKFPWDRTLEDIHMNIESRLHEKIGAVAGKLHTGRSRNDQVCLDMRMYVKKATRHTLTLITELQKQVLILAESNSATFPTKSHNLFCALIGDVSFLSHKPKFSMFPPVANCIAGDKVL